MKYITTKAKILSLLILAISFFGCEEDDEGNILPEVVAGFTQRIVSGTGTVSFLNISENAQNYQWDFGDGTTSAEIEPVKTYTNGTYTVRLTASNIAGATDTFEDEIVIAIPTPPAAPMLPITFDGNNVDYQASTFSGAAFEVVANPAPGGSNDVASNVGAITNSGAEFEGIFFNLGTAIDLSTDQTITMNFWAEAAIDVLVKLEEGTGADTEISASHGGSGWEMLSFDFTSTDSFSRFTMFVDGPGTTAGTFYLDDIAQMGSTGGGDTPTEAAPAPPSRDAADVISLFSNEYTDITVDTFYAGFSAGGGVSDVQVAGDDTKLYTDLDFAGIETIATSVDLSMMTNFHMDVWTATGFDFIAGVVDFGGDGFAGANPDTRGDERTTLQAGMWTSIDVSIADLQAAGLTATPTDFSQLILDVVDVIGTVYVDNIYFYNDGAAGGDTPTVAAPAPPARDAADVISLFSNVYTDITVDTFYAGFSAGGGVMDVQVAGDDTKLYTDLDFAGIETIATSVDLSMMTNFHIDVWTATGFDFITGVVDFGGDGFAGANPDTRGDERTTLSAGMWTSIDVSIADLQAAGLTATPTDFSQLILDVVDVLGTVYVDNIYFYKEAAAPPAPATSLPVNFESNETLSGVFEEGDGVTGQPIANPDASGINTSATVYEFDKVLNAAWYSGMFNIFPSDIDSGAGTTFKVKIWSPKAGINVRMQLEKEGNQGPIVTYNLDQTLTTANSWQELTFDFSSTPLNLADGYDKIVIFPDFDDVGQPAGDGSVYYIDDIVQE